MQKGKNNRFFSRDEVIFTRLRPWNIYISCRKLYFDLVANVKLHAREIFIGYDNIWTCNLYGNMRLSIFHVDQIFVSGWIQDNFLVCNLYATNYFHDIMMCIKDNMKFLLFSYLYKLYTTKLLNTTKILTPIHLLDKLKCIFDKILVE